jgi:hypothetical protein
MIMTGNDSEYIAFVKAHLCEQFLITDQGPPRYFFGIEVSFTFDGLYISQEKYIQDFLARTGLGDEHTVATPMELSVQFLPFDGDPLPGQMRYRHFVGSLVYLVVTRLDISYHILSQFVFAPTSVHYSHLLCVLRYLRGTIISLQLFFPCSSSLQPWAYSDATWASDPSNLSSFMH